MIKANNIQINANTVLKTLQCDLYDHPYTSPHRIAYTSLCEYIVLLSCFLEEGKSQTKVTLGIMPHLVICSQPH